ncbi:hypothetical protein D3C73_744770 [compost metagenome]
MSRTLTWGTYELVVTFTGLTAVAGLKGELKIPYSSITKVSTEHFKLHWSAIRVGGTSVPFGYKAGRFVYKGQKYFLSYKNPSQVIILDLQDHAFDKVVIEVGSPKEIKRGILKRCPALAVESPI